MRHSVLRLSQLFNLLSIQSPDVDVNSYSDLIVSTFFLACRDVKAIQLRQFLYAFVKIGFNPFSPNLSDVSKIMMKSVIAKCDSIIKKQNKHANTRYC